MTVAIVVTFAGYTVASYGWVLLKGWNITFKDWVNPLNPYRWGGAPGTVPAGQVFPGGGGSGYSGGSSESPVSAGAGAAIGNL